MSNVHVQTGAGPPGAGGTNTTPKKVGGHYVDTTNDDFYIAVDTTGPGDWVGPFTGGGIQKYTEQVTIPGDGSGVSVTHGIGTEAISTEFFRQDVSPEEPFGPEWNKVSGNETNAIELFWGFEIDARVVIVG